MRNDKITAGKIIEFKAQLSPKNQAADQGNIHCLLFFLLVQVKLTLNCVLNFLCMKSVPEKKKNENVH